MVHILEGLGSSAIKWSGPYSKRQARGTVVKLYYGDVVSEIVLREEDEGEKRKGTCGL